MPASKTADAPRRPSIPTWWDWDEDGKSIEGAFVRAGTGFTQMGPRPFVVLELDGVERTVWLHHEVLRNQFAREVHRRPDKTIHVGERSGSGSSSRASRSRTRDARTPTTGSSSPTGPSRRRPTSSARRRRVRSRRPRRARRRGAGHDIPFA